MRILVVHKLQSAVEQGDSPLALRALRARIPARADHHMAASSLHRTATDSVHRALDEAGFENRWTEAATPELVTWADAALTVGGDGTLLAASHAIRDTPILGVNSAPRFSVGYFCSTTADTLPAALKALASGSLPIVELTRIRVCINGVPLARCALNEVLYAHVSPAGTSRYSVSVGSVTEAQRSSGVWVSTAAGSTAAIAAAGGQRMDLTARELQYLVREPYRFPGEALRLVRGFTSDPIRVVSEVQESAVYLDGPRLPAPVGVGDEISLDTQAPPLRLFRWTQEPPP